MFKFNESTLDNIIKLPIEKEPFDHLVIDNFFDEDYANKLESEFLSPDDPSWWRYDNAIENKRAMSTWDKFPKNTYNALWVLCSQHFSDLLSKKFNTQLYADFGLNGGGWHMYGKGGKLNLHQDYSIHPKIPFERKFNIIIYLSKDWDPSWNGGLELWSHDHETKKPKELIKTVDIKFNRAVIFDTTQNSWHGFQERLTCPDGTFRKSLAIYYVQEPKESANPDRYKAWFEPDKNQKNDPAVLELIERRKTGNYK